jgi:hypothetical protein
MADARSGVFDEQPPCCFQTINEGTMALLMNPAFHLPFPVDHGWDVSKQDCCNLWDQTCRGNMEMLKVGIDCTISNVTL